MKRNKFIKQIMAVGIDRNRAAAVAATSRDRGLPYDKGLGLYLNTYAMLLHGQDPSILYTTPGGGQA